MKPLVRVLIGGGGIAGLTLANLLKIAGRHVNFEVTIIEAHSMSDTKQTSIGGGIGLWPPSQSVLKQLPYYEKFLQQHCFLMPEASYRNESGKALAKSKPNFEQRFPVQCVDRNQLQAFLLEGISNASNIKLIVEKKISHYERRADEVVLHTTDGSAFRGDILIASDGIHSCIRRCIMSELSHPTITPLQLGYTYFRANVELPTSDGCQWWSSAFETWGSHHNHAFRFGYVPLKPPYAFWFIAIKTDENHPILKPIERIELIDNQTKKFLQELIQDWQPVKNKLGDIAVDYTKLLDHTTDILRTDIAKIANVTHFPWQSKDNRVILIGDAAHATAPNIAQGAGLSIEDAAELAHLLDNQNYLNGLINYESGRKQRAKVVQNYADTIAKVGQLQTSTLRQLRNFIMRTSTYLLPSLEQSLFEKAVSHSLGGNHQSPYWQAPILDKNVPSKHGLFGSLVPPQTPLTNTIINFKQSNIGGAGKGSVTVELGKGFVAIIAKLFGLPKAMQSQPFHAKVINLSASQQQWTRIFGYKTPKQRTYSTTHSKYCDKHLQSYLSEGVGGCLDKAFRFFYDIQIKNDDTLSYVSKGMTLFDRWQIPLPEFLLPSSTWIEKPTATGWQFDGTISFPLLGKLMSYRGEFTPFKTQLKNESQRLIIAGGTGMIGYEICHSFLRQGYEIFCLTRHPHKSMNLAGVSMVQLHSNWSHLIDNATIIINLAGSNPGAKRWSTTVKNKIVKSRLDVIELIIQNIQNAKQKPKKYLQASAVGIYGHSLTKAFTEEDSPIKTDNPGTQFRINTCLDIEAKANQADCDVINLRLGHVLSNRGGILPYLRLAGLLNCSRISHGKQFVPFIHIDDVVNAVAFIAQSKNLNSDCINLTAPKSCMNQLLLSKLHYFQWLPKWPLPEKLLTFLVGGSAVVFTDSENIQPQRLQKAGFTFDYPDIEKAIVGLK